MPLRIRAGRGRLRQPSVGIVFIALDLDGGENAFLAVFALEIALKLYAFGVRAFFRKMWNVFDVVVVGSAVTVSILRAAIGQDISREVK